MIMIALTVALAILFPIFLSSSADATFWSASVKSNFTSWSIYTPEPEHEF